MLTTGFGTSHAHAMPGHGGIAQSQHATAGATHDQHHQQPAQAQDDCDHAALATAQPAPHKHGTGGCCVNACFPPAVARDAVRFFPPDFDVLPVRPRADQAPALSSPNDLFRPPRGRA